MSLSEEERKALVDYRIEKAFATFGDVEKSITLSMWSVAANRMYYALYYAASALLIKDEHTVRTHNGVMILLNQHYVRTGLLTKEDGWLFGRIFAFRQGSDYDDFIDATEVDVMMYLPKAKLLLEKLATLTRGA